MNDDYDLSTHDDWIDQDLIDPEEPMEKAEAERDARREDGIV